MRISLQKKIIISLLLGVFVGSIEIYAFFNNDKRMICANPAKNYVPATLDSNSIRFAAIGDYGEQGTDESGVANLIETWNPDFIITLGDNNYGQGTSDTIDSNIGQYFHNFIGNYNGSYGDGALRNRFYPVLGNHDWMSDGAQPYLDYFTLPANERYYSFSQGPVQFFALSSDPSEPDGNTVDSVQAEWFHNQISSSTAPFQIVFMHHPPYSSGMHGANLALQWPFAQWGVDAVLTGHDHDYERLEHDGIPYIVNGLGGQIIYGFKSNLEANSLVQYNCSFGAMLIDANAESMTFRFITDTGSLVDSYTIYAVGADELLKPD